MKVYHILKHSKHRDRSINEFLMVRGNVKMQWGYPFEHLLEEQVKNIIFSLKKINCSLFIYNTFVDLKVVGKAIVKHSLTFLEVRWGVEGLQVYLFNCCISRSYKMNLSCLNLHSVIYQYTKLKL